MELLAFHEMTRARERHSYASGTDGGFSETFTGEKGHLSFLSTPKLLGSDLVEVAEHTRTLIRSPLSRSLRLCVTSRSHRNVCSEIPRGRAQGSLSTDISTGPQATSKLSVPLKPCHGFERMKPLYVVVTQGKVSNGQAGS